MNYIFGDLETSGASTSFDSVLECCFILTNDKFQELDRIHLKSRLEEGVVPNLGALTVTGFDVNWLKQNPSPYSNNQLLLEKLKTWGPAVYFGFNSHLFDWIFLSKTFFKYLKPPYFLNTKGNKLGDVLPVIRAAKMVDETVIKTITTEKGNPSFKLSDLMQHEDAHGAVPDTIACMKVAETIYKNEKTRPVWESSLKTLSRQECDLLLQKEKIFTNVEYYYGKIHFFVSKYLLNHPIYKWNICWDMKVSPDEYMKMEYNDLKKALSKSPKVLRSIKNNKSPVLLNKSYGLATSSYSRIPDLEFKKRAQMLESSPEFLERINSILIEQHEERGVKEDKINLQPEETLYSGGFANETDSKLMDQFHKVNWDEKVKLLDKFTDERYQFFGKRIIFQESPEKLPDSLAKDVKKNIAKKIFSTEKQNWTTIPEFYKSIDDARNKYENNEKVLKKLDEYNNFVMDIEKKYETA